MFSGKNHQRTIKTKFKKDSNQDREYIKERKKHHDKATYRLLKQENQEYEYAI